MEVVFWKYAYFLSLSNQKELAKEYFSKALAVCYTGNSYLTMRFTGLAIYADYILFLSKGNNKDKHEAEVLTKKLLSKIVDINRKARPAAAEEFLGRVNKVAEGIQKELDEDTLVNLYKLSRMVAY